LLGGELIGRLIDRRGHKHRSNLRTRENRVLEVISTDFEGISNDTISWDIAENPIKDKWSNNPAFSDMMEMRAIFSFLAVFSSWTGFDFVVHWMIFMFFPSMTFDTFFSEMTAVFVVEDKIGRFPIGTRGGLVGGLIGFSAVVLPIVSINTESLVMLS
jgi:hypothetical protein